MFFGRSAEVFFTRLIPS